MHPTCSSREPGKARGMQGNAGQGAGEGQAAGRGRQDCGPGVTWLSPKPLPAERRGFAGIPSPRSKPSPVPTLCLPVPPQLLLYRISHFPAHRAGPGAALHRSAQQQRDGARTPETPPPLPSCQPVHEKQPFFVETLEITHLWEGHGRCTDPRAEARGGTSLLCPKQEEEGRALQKSGLQREGNELCLNMYILLWQPRKDAARAGTVTEGCDVLCWEAPKPSVHHTGVVAPRASGSCQNVAKTLPPPKILVSL